ncbi:MAG: hypothetical protein IJY69_02035 [Clostridia bacterium]|nr:hypothetical protein [Clostridia bacterium]
MDFLDSYKRVEKICNEMYGGNHGLSFYIDDMIKTSGGNRYVSGWEEDLKQLKQYRWIRNRIVHDPGCTAENMSDIKDALWLDDFYSRIIAGKDPLALYHKKKLEIQRGKNSYQSTNNKKTQHYIHNRRSGCLTLALIGVLIVVATIFIMISL